MQHRARKTISPFIAMSIAAHLLSACQMMTPVSGQIVRSTERFDGGVHGPIGGFARVASTGALVGQLIWIKTNYGVSCSGNIEYDNQTKGRGTLECDDGRSGPFELIVADNQALGTGYLAGELLTFRIGKI